jgi:hypothetical protein
MESIFKNTVLKKRNKEKSICIKSGNQGAHIPMLTTRPNKNYSMCSTVS